MKEYTLEKRQARRFILAHQGLWPPRALAGKSAVLDYIRHVGCIQFDPLNVVGHNTELVLQSRVSDFQPDLLQDLLYQERKLVDGWDKNASIYCVEDWPYFGRYRRSAQNGFGKSHEEVKKVLPQVREALDERGPLSSIDLDLDRTVDWGWAPTRLARAALDSMYAWGELVIQHRVGTRKIYDYAHHHIPQELLEAPDPNKDEEAYRDWRVLRRIGSMGLIWNRSGSAWLGMGSIKSREREAALARLAERNKVIQVNVEGIDPSFYVRSADQATLDDVLNGRDPAPKAAILGPLDNLLWDRRMIEELFGFSYVWEVYKPVAEREYGYYVLPILYGDRFVARFEPQRDEEDGRLIIKDWWWEANVMVSPTMRAAEQAALRDALIHCFDSFLRYLGLDKLWASDKVVRRADLAWLIEGTNETAQ